MKTKEDFFRKVQEMFPEEKIVFACELEDGWIAKTIPEGAEPGKFISGRFGVFGKKGGKVLHEIDLLKIGSKLEGVTNIAPDRI